MSHPRSRRFKVSIGECKLRPHENMVVLCSSHDDVGGVNVPNLQPLLTSRGTQGMMVNNSRSFQPRDQHMRVISFRQPPSPPSTFPPPVAVPLTHFAIARRTRHTEAYFSLLESPRLPFPFPSHVRSAPCTDWQQCVANGPENLLRPCCSRGLNGLSRGSTKRRGQRQA